MIGKQLNYGTSVRIVKLFGVKILKIPTFCRTIGIAIEGPIIEAFCKEKITTFRFNLRILCQLHVSLTLPHLTACTRKEKERKGRVFI